MNHLYTRPGGVWSPASGLLAAELADLDAKTVDSLSGSGGVYALSEELVIAGALVTFDDLYINDSVFIGDSLAVTNRVQVGNLLQVDDRLEVAGDVSVDGSTTMNGSAAVGGDLGVFGGLNVDGDFFLHGGLTVDGPFHAFDEATFESVVNVHGDFFLSGNGYFALDALVSGGFEVNGLTEFHGDVNFDALCTFAYVTIHNSTAIYNGNATYEGNATFNGNVDILDGRTIVITDKLKFGTNGRMQRKTTQAADANTSYNPRQWQVVFIQSTSGDHTYTIDDTGCENDDEITVSLHYGNTNTHTVRRPDGGLLDSLQSVSGGKKFLTCRRIGGVWQVSEFGAFP